MVTLSFEDHKHIMREKAASELRLTGLTPTRAQVGVLCKLFRIFCEMEVDVEVLFAGDDTWFRHRVLELLWGHKSTSVMDSATISSMIGYLGTDFSGEWRLSDTGKEFLYAAIEVLEEKFPTQKPLW